MRYETTTRAIPPTVLALAREFFGQRYGLREVSATPRSVSFEGGGGGVAVSARGTREGTAVEVVAREWDYQAQEFLRLLRQAR
ncbi:MAG: hypothetical protein KatS3mg061_1158 [Dehalococcoidia bacterium]|nr:MAG: hypothetical protein KatS3mg061_1158 [Dehalococcoidia bacterium]